MKIDLTIQILNIDGSTIPEKKKGEYMTLKTVFCGALLMQEDGKNIPGIEKARRYHLAMKIYPKDTICLDVDDTKLIKDIVGVHYIPIVVGQVWDILDPPEVSGMVCDECGKNLDGLPETEFVTISEKAGLLEYICLACHTASMMPDEGPSEDEAPPEKEGDGTI